MVIGHQKQWNLLKRLAENKTFSHAYLFAGPEKLGKKTLALQWLSLFLGNAKDFINHPDFMFIEPVEKEIKISQIRDLIQRMSLKSSSSIKAAIINNAHSMNQEAQTALLKTLEEPRGSSILILISDKIHYLFPTILSRVQVIKFSPVRNQEINKYLLNKGFSQKEAEDLSSISSGRPGAVMDFIADKKEMEVFKRKIEEVKGLSKSMLYSRFQYVKDLSEEPQETQKTLDVWLKYFRDVLLFRFSSGNSDIRDENFKSYSSDKLKNIINLIQTTKLLLSQTNVNARLALERLVMEI
jgi:DNA polymerase-3 subunit delta'